MMLLANSVLFSFFASSLGAVAEHDTNDHSQAAPAMLHNSVSIRERHMR